MGRVSSYLYNIPVEGQRVKLIDIEGKDVVIEGVGFFEAELGPACAIQMQYEELPIWAITFSTIVQQALEKVKESLPLTGRFMRHTSQSDRAYWTVE